MCSITLSLLQASNLGFFTKGILVNFKTANGRDRLQNSNAEAGDGITIIRLNMPNIKGRRARLLYLFPCPLINFLTFKAGVVFPSTAFAASTNMPHAHSNIEMPDPVTVADVREIAQKRLDPAAWDYYITGADDEQTVARNETIFKK